jgi:hypothetical protein
VARVARETASSGVKTRPNPDCGGVADAPGGPVGTLPLPFSGAWERVPDEVGYGNCTVPVGCMTAPFTL